MSLDVPMSFSFVGLLHQSRIPSDERFSVKIYKVLFQLDVVDSAVIIHSDILFRPTDIG